MCPDKDALYWQLNAELCDFYRRNFWFWRHFTAGTLVSQRRREAVDLSELGKDVAIELIRLQGLQAHRTVPNCAFDLWVTRDGQQAARVEVKTSLCLENKGRFRYQANIRAHQRKDTDVVIFLAKNDGWYPYIIPITAVGQRSNIAIWSVHPGDYGGQWSPYLGAWSHLHAAVANTAPRVWQFSLTVPAGGRVC